MTKNLTKHEQHRNLFKKKKLCYVDLTFELAASFLIVTHRLFIAMIIDTFFKPSKA